ncbi:MAG TPA: protein kinase, partial [Pirellulaceae bacterium]|nr:protein kinase [Pirellulaceae bacterium]
MSGPPKSFRTARGSTDFTARGTPRDFSFESLAQGVAEDRLPKSFGRYEVRGLIARGGFGAVYLGYDSQLERTVAIKVPRRAGDEGRSDEFLSEARRAAQLRHAGIMTIYDVGMDGDVCYIVCDYLQGVTMQRWLENHAMSWEQAARVIASVADALQHAHNQRTVHRDIKPENIMLVDGLTPVLLDFGLALSERDSAVAQRGVIAGTLPYMSPEQVRGETQRLDGRTDIYSLGVVLYRLLCGHLPFVSPDAASLFRQILHDAPPSPRQFVPALPPRLEAACLKCLAKEPAQRFATAAELAEELRLTSLEMLAAAQQPSTTVAPQLIGMAGAIGSSQSAIGSSRSQRQARDAERRQVTVLFVKFELVFDAASDSPPDIDEQDELVREFRELCLECVRRQEGTPVTAAGEEMLACFGFPVAFEDAAQRAVRAALEIVRETKQRDVEWRQRQDVGVEASLAVHTGAVIVSDNPATSQGTTSIVGEAPLVATRLAPQMPGGVVVITAATERLTRGYFIAQPIGTRQVKGVAEPIALFQVTGVAQAQTRLEAAELSGLTPLIGREIETGFLRQRWNDAIDGHGQIVLLSGEAGLGKSRLVRDLKEHVRRLDSVAHTVVLPPG